MYIHIVQYTHTHQEVTAFFFLWFGWEQGMLFLTLGDIVSVGGTGQTG